MVLARWLRDGRWGCSLNVPGLGDDGGAEDDGARALAWNPVSQSIPFHFPMPSRLAGAARFGGGMV